MDLSVNSGDIKHQTEKVVALTVTRYSSQVCREWCRVLLESPTIWAISLDLQRLNQANDDWQNEILRRTGDCRRRLVQGTALCRLFCLPLG